MPAKQCANPTGGRPCGGLAIYWRSDNNFIHNTKLYTDQIIGSTPETKYSKYVIVNIYMSCGCKTLKRVHEYQPCVSCISNFVSEESFVEINLFGDMCCDSDNGTFFH